MIKEYICKYILIEIDGLVQLEYSHVIIKSVCLKIWMSSYFNNSKFLTIDVIVLKIPFSQFYCKLARSESVQNNVRMIYKSMYKSITRWKKLKQNDVSYGLFLLSLVQCAAVTTWSLDTRAPPHQNSDLPFPCRYMATIHGYSPSNVSFPPTIRA